MPWTLPPQLLFRWLLWAMVWGAVLVPAVDGRRGSALWRSAREESLKRAFVPKGGVQGQPSVQPQGLHRAAGQTSIHKAHADLKDSLMHVPRRAGAHKGLSAAVHTAQHSEFE